MEFGVDRNALQRPMDGDEAVKSAGLSRYRVARHSGRRRLAPRLAAFPLSERQGAQIGEAALTLAGEAVRQAIASAAETSNSAEIFLTRIARGMASDLETSDYKEGCPIATTALETSSQSDVLGAATRTAFHKWENEIRRGLERFGIGEAELVATTLLSQLEGALLLARTYRSLEPMHRAEAALKLLLGQMKRDERS
jgi:TetR/AcrR family transcriptional repressor of lmrAB and yxaGH operons